MRIEPAAATALLAALVCAGAVGAQDDGAIRTAVIVHGLDRLSEDAYQRILTAPEVDYVCFQQIMPAGPLPEPTVSRARELATADARTFACEYVGIQNLPKEGGACPTYHLREAVAR